MKMKKILNHLVVVFFAALSAVSCLPDGDYSQTAVVVATYEYTEAPFDSDSLFYKSDKGLGIGWGTLGFMHKVDTTSWTFEGGFLLSRQKGTLYDPADTAALSKSDSLARVHDLYRVNAVKDTVNNNSYLVFCQNPDSSKMPERDVLFMIEENAAAQAQMCFVNNTSYVAYKAAQTFVPGDRITLTATGYLKGAKTGEVSMLLADFSAQKDSIVSKWTAFDLTKLGVFDAIDFNVASTREEVPAYFCMDNFAAQVTISNTL